MTKAKIKVPANSLVSKDILKEIITSRPLRLFIKKQKKKGDNRAPFALRSDFIQSSTEKQMKYFQKAIDKYIQILDENNVSEHAQIDGKLFENLLTKKEQNAYFQSINAPSKPLNTASAYYYEVKKQENVDNPKPWSVLSTDEKKPYTKMLNDAKNDYSVQAKNFADNLPERLKSEYLLYIKQANHSSHGTNEPTNSATIQQRRKSVQSVPESFQSITNDNQLKLNRSQSDGLHKCKPNILYYENKVPDDEKPTFTNPLLKNAHMRSVFNQLKDKKRHKFIVKATKKWQEYLQDNPAIVENQIPTLHSLLGKNDDIYYYFTTLGLPSRPPNSALYLYNNEKQQTNSQQNWADLPQTTKDEYIKRLSKLKNEYHQKLVEFVEKTLPSDYVRLEFFRNVKFVSKDYELATKDHANDKDEGQLKITQYLKPKKKVEIIDGNEFDRIKQQLLSTALTNEQKKLVERLGQLMNKYREESTTVKKTPSNSQSSSTVKPILSRRPSTTSDDVVLVNGEISSDNNDDHSESTAKKSKKKHKRDRSESEEGSRIKANNDMKTQSVSSSSAKKRK